MLIVIYLIIVICVFIALKLLIIEEESSTRLNMFMFKKVKKDIKTLSMINIIKRNFHCFWSRIDKGFEKKLDNIGVKGSKHIAGHPTIYAKNKDGTATVGNLTSSPKVNDEHTMPVGLKKNGETSYLFIDKSNNIEKNGVKVFNEYICNNIFNFTDIKIDDSTINNIGNEIEKVTGKELKNRNLEPINSVMKEPVDKL